MNAAALDAHRSWARTAPAALIEEGRGCAQRAATGKRPNNG
jgi:hypothetical protein